MVENRAHPRIPISTEVTVRSPKIGSRTARTIDVSDGGVLVQFPGCPFVLGDAVSVQVNSLEDAPLLQGVVVRVKADEFALAFMPVEDGETG